MVDQHLMFTTCCLKNDFVSESQILTTTEDSILKGDVQLGYISPDTLLKLFKFRRMLLPPPYRKNLVALVIDEAYCVKN